MTLRQMLKADEENGNLILANAIAKKSSFRIGELSDYASICGGWYEGVHQWMTHNVDSINECENEKYLGFEVRFEGQDFESKFYIKQFIMNLEVKNYKHAMNLFCKQLIKL